MNDLRPRRIAAALALSPFLAAPALAQDWPMWGHDESRNMTSEATGLPGTFVAGEFAGATDKIEMGTTKNVKWIAKLGSQSYGNPTVADGRIYVGTNNDSPRDPRFKGDRCTVYCLDDLIASMEGRMDEPKNSGRRVAVALEAELALKQSSAKGGQRVELPLKDRSLGLTYDWFR